MEPLVLLNVDASLIVACVSLAATIATLVFTILAFIVAKRIGRRQLRRDEYSYLLFSIVVPCNAIETDIMLLNQGTFDDKFEKNAFDKEVLLAICTAKSFAKMIKNDNLFDYLDGLLTGETKEQLGQLIEDYFKARGVIEKKMKLKTPASITAIKKEGERLYELFFERTRIMRDDTIEAIDSYLER